MRAVRAAVLADARARPDVRARVLGVDCDVVPEDAGLATRGAAILRHRCLAVTFRGAGTALGEPYLARVDFRRGTFGWCRYTPPGGEGAAAFPAAPPARCSAPPVPAPPPQ